MSYPPTTQVTNRTGQTSALSGVHANDHNATSAAINDIVSQLGPDPAGSYLTVDARLTGIENLVYNVKTYGAIGNYDGVSVGADDTAAIQAAIDAAAVTGGIVFFPKGNYKVTNPLIVTSYLVSILGAGSGITVIYSTFNGDTFRIHSTSFVSTVQWGQVSELTLFGPGSLNSVGIHYGDALGVSIVNVEMLGYTGTNSAGVWIDNATNYSGRIQTRKLHLSRNTVGIKFGVSGGSSTFVGVDLDLRLDIIDGQIGILVQDSAFLPKASIKAWADVTDFGTVMRIKDTARVQGGNYHLAAAQIAGTGGRGVVVENGAKLTGFGLISCGTLTHVNNNPTSSLTPTFRVVSPVAEVDALVVLDAGSISNFQGSGSPATVEPTALLTLGDTYAHSGFLHNGSTIQSPYVCMYDADYNAFVVSKQALNAAPGSMTTVMSVANNGLLKTSALALTGVSNLSSLVVTAGTQSVPIEILRHIAPAATNDFLQFQTSANGVLAQVDGQGNFITTKNFGSAVTPTYPFQSLSAAGPQFVAQHSSARPLIGMRAYYDGVTDYLSLYTDVVNSVHPVNINSTGSFFSHPIVLSFTDTNALNLRNTSGTSLLSFNTSNGALTLVGPTGATMETGLLRLGRSNASAGLQSMVFTNSLLQDAVIGRIANSDDLIFGFNPGSGVVEKARITTTGIISIAGISRSGAKPAPQASAPTDTVNTGTSSDVAAADHVHAREGFGAPVAIGVALANGTATSVPRSDHVHTIVGAWNTVGGVSQPAYQNSWVTLSGGAAARFRKSDPSHVELSGAISSGTSGSTVFTLPSGYRPIENVRIPVVVSGGVGYALITSAGSVQVTQITGAATTYTYLHAVSFAID